MPQFVKDGPDIPERLLQSHEEGKVVFFCGAGVSYRAGLPGFAGLVERICDSLYIELNTVQKKAIKAGRYMYWFARDGFVRRAGKTTTEDGRYSNA